MSKNLDLNKRSKILKEKFLEGLEILSEDKKVFLIYPIPQAPTNILSFLIKDYYNNLLFNFSNPMKEKINYKKKIFEDFNKETISFFDSINIKNLTKVNLSNILCPNNCIFFNENKIFLSDNIHLSYLSSEIIVENILKKVNKNY